MKGSGLHHVILPSPLAGLKRERVATQCVCCAGDDLATSPAILMPFLSDRIWGWKPVRIDASWGLRTISEGVSYAPCNTRLCRSCGLMFLDLRFSDEEMATLYDDYRGEAYTSLRDFYEPGYAARNVALNQRISYLSQVEEFIRPHLPESFSMLDWGGGTGKNTPFLGEAARIDIFDISEVAVIDGMDAIGFEKAIARTYGLIVCNMVLEHAPYPADLLLSMQPAMNDDTLLYIEVPFERVMRSSDPVRSDMKRHWHEHVNFYSETALRRLVGNCALEIVEFRVLPTEVAGEELHIFQLLCRRSRH